MTEHNEAGPVDILMFAEDPGAANFLAPLDPMIRKAGWNGVTLAVGLAADIFSRRGVSHLNPGNDNNRSGSLLAELKPRLVLAGTASNPDTLGLQLIAYAKNNSMTTVAAVDAAMNAELRFCGRTQNPLAYAPDWLLVPDTAVADIYVRLGMPAARVVACGNPHHDFVITRGNDWRKNDRRAARKRIFPDAPESARIVVFVSEGSARVMRNVAGEPVAGNDRGPGASAGRSEIALQMLLDALGGSADKPYLVLRIHPKDRPADYAQFAGAIDLLNADGDPLETVCAADLAVGTTSMLVTESALVGRPVIAIVPEPAEDCWLPLIGLGVIPVARTARDVARLVGEKLQSGANAGGGEVETMRGDSGERTMNALRQILAA